MTSKIVKFVTLNNNNVEFANTFEALKEDFTNFLRNDALDMRKGGYCITYLMLADKTLIGYFTLSAYSIDLKSSGVKEIKQFRGVQKIPSILLGQIAIHKEFVNKGLGKTLLQFAIGTIKELRKKIGIRFIVVNSYDRESRNWWEKREFQLLPGKINRTRGKPFLYFDLKKVEEQEQVNSYKSY
ncbi:hypothetical protein IPdc08_01322 [archaeon]|nr:hypothetical protein IPdc08_01322 [archaeon]